MIQQSGLIYTGGEDRNITAWDTNSGRAAFTIEGAHSSRVKGIVIMNGNDEDSGGDALPSLVSSASSDGVIRVWDVRFAMKERPNPLAEVNTKARLTCLAGTSFKCELFIIELSHFLLCHRRSRTFEQKIPFDFSNFCR